MSALEDSALGHCAAKKGGGSGRRCRGGGEGGGGGWTRGGDDILEDFAVHCAPERAKTALGHERTKESQAGPSTTSAGNTDQSEDKQFPKQRKSSWPDLPLASAKPATPKQGGAY